MTATLHCVSPALQVSVQFPPHEATPAVTTHDPLVAAQSSCVAHTKQPSGPGLQLSTVAPLHCVSPIAVQASLQLLLLHRALPLAASQIFPLAAQSLICVHARQPAGDCAQVMSFSPWQVLSPRLG